MDFENRNEHIVICLFVMICFIMYIIDLHRQIKFKDNELNAVNIVLTSCQDNIMEVEFTWFMPEECEWEE